MALFDFPNYGTDLVNGKVWTAGTIVSHGPAEAQFAEHYFLDLILPSQGVQPHPESLEIDHVIIPRGRFVGPMARSMSATGSGILTIADGWNTLPLGMTFENVLRSTSQPRPTQLPRWKKAGYMAVPYLQAVNDAYGAISEGDYVTAHYGATTNAVGFAYEDRGKPVKWIEKKVYWDVVASALTVSLVNATLVGVRPVVTAGVTAAGVVTPVVSTQYDDILNVWTATFGAAVVSVMYTHGQSPRMIGGVVGRLMQVSSTYEQEGWLKWVETDYLANPLFMPQTFDYPTQTVGFDTSGNFSLGVSETPVATSSANVFSLANGRIAPHKKIVVYVVTGSIMGLDGALTNISGQPLTLDPATYFENYSVGQYYRVDIGLGKLLISDAIRRVDGSAIQASDLRVAYYYAFKYEYGRLNHLGGGVGQRGLTDGRFTGIPGVPTHLERAAADRRYVNAAGAFGEMRIVIG